MSAKVAKRRKIDQFPTAPKANIAATSTALTATFRRSSIWKLLRLRLSLLVSLLGSLYEGLLGCLGAVMASACGGFKNCSSQISFYLGLDAAMAQCETAIFLMITAIAL